MTRELPTTGETPGEGQFGKRLEELALAFFLVMTGALWLAPDSWTPEGSWLAAAGLILLGLNAARLFHGLRPSGFGIAAGSAALAAGGGRILGCEHLLVPFLLIGLGMAMIGKGMAASASPDAAAGKSAGGKCC